MAYYGVVLNTTLIAYYSPAPYQGVAPVINYLYGGELPQMTERETLHMQDIREILFAIQWFLILGLLLGWSHLIIHKNVVLHPTKYIVSGLSVVYAAALLFFNQSFLLMHQLLFTNDYWQLALDSYLIQLFPQSFFVSMALTLLFYMVIVSALLWYCDYRIRKRQQHKKAKL
jgi:uncharacterized membrane protein